MKFSSGIIARIFALAIAFAVCSAPIHAAAYQQPAAADDLSAAEEQARSSPSPENYLTLSMQYYRAGRYQDSITASNEALRLRADYAEAYNNIAAAYASLAMWDDAIQAAQRALKINPDYPLAQNNLNWATSQKRLLQAPQGPDDVAGAETQVKVAPTPENYLNLSVQYNRAGKYKESITACREALRLRPDYAEAYNNIAAAAASLEMWDDAIKAGQEALRINPEYQLAKNNLAWALSQKKLHGSGTPAEDLFIAEAQTRLAPTAPNYLNLSLQYDRNARYRDSITAASEAARLKPDYAEAYNNMAAAYGRLEMWDEAVKAAQEALRIKPDYQLAKNNLAWMSREKKERESR